MRTFESWDSYFEPSTLHLPENRRTLRNRLGVIDADELRIVEYAFVNRRIRELDTGQVDIDQTFDSTHLRAIHRYLFQDVYAWAGQYRTVNLGKDQRHPFAHVDNIDRYLADAHRLVVEADWTTMSPADVADTAAEVFAYVNQAHPFREGNGRAARLFIDDVIGEAGYRLDLTNINAVVWNRASADSAPEAGYYEPDPTPLRQVFRVAVVLKEQEYPSILDDLVG